MNEPILAPVVVGVDGSEDGAQALRWAATEAALRGCAVEAISVSTAGERVLKAPTARPPRLPPSRGRTRLFNCDTFG